MILYKRNNFIFFFIIFLFIENIYSQPDFNKTDELPPNDINKDPKHNGTDHWDCKEKEISLIFENNKLKIQLEVYNIYFYFLLIINILFVILILSFFIYKICLKINELNTQEDEKREKLLNYIDSKNIDNNENNEEKKDINEEPNNDLNKDNSFMNEELFNNSGIEAPPASKVSYM